VIDWKIAVAVQSIVFGRIFFEAFIRERDREKPKSNNSDLYGPIIQ